MNEYQPTIFVVDDDRSILKSIKRLLQSNGYRVETFLSAREFMEFDYDNQGPACLVLDVMMPEMSGLDLQETILSWDISMPIVFITALHDVPTSVSAMKKGAIDFLTKPFREIDLLNAVQSALQKDLKMRVASNELTNLKRRFALLTPRERQVLSHVISGKLNKQIASELDISERTVKAHRSQVMEKMEVGSLAELVQISGKLGIQPSSLDNS
ncbi:MAG: response regulator transcription factor [Candidatus Aminicenantes bacterium]|nr:response regulator transcription factor [Candidatus Aminicenantes bacterium]